MGIKDLANFSWMQLTFSALLLLIQVHVPCKFGTILLEEEVIREIRINCHEAPLR